MDSGLSYDGWVRLWKITRRQVIVYLIAGATIFLLEGLRPGGSLTLAIFAAYAMGVLFGRELGLLESLFRNFKDHYHTHRSNKRP